MARHVCFGVCVLLVCAWGFPASGQSSGRPASFSGVLEPGWNLVVVPSGAPAASENGLGAGATLWRVSTSSASHSAWMMSPVERSFLEEGEAIWVYSDERRVFELFGYPPVPSVEPEGWQLVYAVAPGASLHPRFDRVLRWEPEFQSYRTVSKGEVLAPATGYFGYSSKAAVRLTLPPAKPGVFEPPSVLAEPAGAAALVHGALSGFEGRTLAHVVHVTRSDRNEAVHYYRSLEAGKPGSFASALVWTLPGFAVVELVVAARGDRVSVAWIQRRETAIRAGAAAPQSQLLLAQSRDGGHSFYPPRVIRSNPSHKRGLAMAYDASLQHHLVWGESNRAYYLKNLAGEPSNVFDLPKRMPAAEAIKYLAKYEPDEMNGCECPQCWCPESYVPDEGSYETRIEESYVYPPSLHVSKTTVRIVARQTRMWDNRPVPNAAWSRMLLAPVYTENIVQRSRPVRFVVGWGKAWKHAYEPGDEALFEKLGSQYQYRYDGRWHEQDEIKIAERPLSGRADDDFSPAWQIVSAAVVGHGAGDGMPSYPQLASMPQGGLALVYEDGVSENPNTPGQNPIRFQTSMDNGRTWSTARTIDAGYVPRLGVTREGYISLPRSLKWWPRGVRSCSRPGSRSVRERPFDWRFFRLRPWPPLRSALRSMKLKSTL